LRQRGAPMPVDCMTGKEVPWPEEISLSRFTK